MKATLKTQSSCRDARSGQVQILCSLQNMLFAGRTHLWVKSDFQHPAGKMGQVWDMDSGKVSSIQCFAQSVKMWEFALGHPIGQGVGTVMSQARSFQRKAEKAFSQDVLKGSARSWHLECGNLNAFDAVLSILWWRAQNCWCFIANCFLRGMCWMTT